MKKDLTISNIERQNFLNNRFAVSAIRQTKQTMEVAMNKGKWKKLNDFCDIQAGGTPLRHKPDFWKNGNIPWVKIADIKGKYTSSVSEFITTKGLNNSSAKIFQSGTILYTIFATIGEVSILTIEAATNQAIAGIKIKDSLLVDCNYLYYFLLSMKKDLIRIGRGIAQNNINLGILKGLSIWLPKISQQRHIAATLDKVNALIALRKKQLEELDALAESVFYDRFGDPVRNEKGWAKLHVKEIGKVKIGPFGSLLHSKDYTENGVPIVNPCHMEHGKVVPNYQFTISSEKLVELTSYRMKEGDIVIGRRGDIGRCALISKNNEGFLCGTGSLFIRLNQCINPVFMLRLIMSKQVVNMLKAKAKGATMLNINCSIVEHLLVPVPPLPLQTRFAAVIKKIEAQKSLVRKALKESEDLFQRLMQDLFQPN